MIQETQNRRFKFVKSNQGFVRVCFSVLLFISGCSGVGSDVLAGRKALQTGRPEDAVGYLTRAADADPNYKIPYRVRAGVLAYLGRAYLETGKDTEARQTLERAVKLDKDEVDSHFKCNRSRVKTSAGVLYLRHFLGV
jgi:Tfp pilus assembly protein PilF